ncbi:MAG: glycosyltransferase family 2 protein [Acidobacteriota bacterium]|nr:glycosyltransferase family 2 protein [Acidobacteriota bacterium]
MSGLRVVIVNYEAGDMLREAVRSVEPLADAGHEVIVVDNASNDGSADAIESECQWATLLRMEENLGFGTACNRGAEGAAEVLLFLNPDATLTPGSGEKLLAAFDADPRLGMAAPRLFSPDGRRQFSWEPTPGLVGEAARKLRNPFEGQSWAHDGIRSIARLLGDEGFLSGAGLAVRREAFEEVGGFDEGFFLYFEDADLCLRLRQAGWGLSLVGEARAVHDKGRGGARGDAVEVAYREAQFRFYRKHRSARASRILIRGQRRRFEALADAQLRARLVGVCDEAERALVTDR